MHTRTDITTSDTGGRSSSCDTYQWSRSVCRNADKPSITSKIAIVRAAQGVKTMKVINAPA